MFGFTKEDKVSILKKNPYKFFIFGVGQCGGNVARELLETFPGSNVGYMNTNHADIDYLEGDLWTKEKPIGNKLLLGDGGTGRSLKTGAGIVTKHIDLVNAFVDDKLDGNNYDFIVLVAGLGGGTGSSFIQPLTAILASKNKKIILLLTLPEMSSALPALPNAGVVLDSVQKNQKYYSNVFLISNDYLKENQGIGGTHGYWTKANSYIAQNLMVLMNLNNLGYVSRSYGSLDEKELLRVFTFGKGYGDFRILKFSNFKIEDKEFIDAFRKESHIFLKDSRITTAAAVAIVILTPPSDKVKDMSYLVDRAFSLIPKAMSNPPFLLKGVFESESLKDEVMIFCCSAGLSQPPIVNQLINNSKSSINRMQKKVSTQHDVGVEALGLDDLDDNFMPKE